MNNKQYLGDGVYVEYLDAYTILLATNNGILNTNVIYLDKIMVEQLAKFVETLWKHSLQSATPENNSAQSITDSPNQET